MTQKLINPKYYYHLFIAIIQFVQNPTLREEEGMTNREKLINTLILLIIDFCLVAVVVALSLSLRPKNLGMSNLQDSISPSIHFLWLVIVMPLMEETTFRLSLVFKPIFLSLSIAMSAYYFMTFYLLDISITDINHYFLIRVGISLLLGSIAFLVLKKNADYINRFWNNNFRWIFYFSILTFGFAHISNYALSIRNVLLAPIIVLPQLICGVFLGYIRVKYGFIYSYASHLINNSIPYLMLTFIIS